MFGFIFVVDHLHDGKLWYDHVDYRCQAVSKYNVDVYDSQILQPKRLTFSSIQIRPFFAMILKLKGQNERHPTEG